MRLPKKFAQKSRKIFYFIHLWTGLLLGLWLIMMGLTGSALSWRKEWTEWEVRYRVAAVTPRPEDKMISVSQAMAALEKSDPELAPVRSISLPNPRGENYGGGYYVYHARNEVNGKPARRIILVDPVTARVYPPVYEETMWMHTIEAIHQNLLIGVKGIIANGVGSCFTLFMLLSGLWLWWPSNLKQLKQRIWIKRGVSLKRTLYDLHNMMGVYLYGLLFLLALTGVLIALNGQIDQSVRKTVNRLAGVQDDGTGGRRGGGMGGGGGEGRRGTAAPDEDIRGKTLTIDEVVAKARAAFPNNTMMYIRMPRRDGQPYESSFDFISFNYGAVRLDPYTGAPLNAPAQTSTPGENAMNIVFQLHYGWFGNNWSKVLYFISGFLPLGLFITGVWMWLKKKKSSAKGREMGKLRKQNQKTPVKEPASV